MKNIPASNVPIIDGTGRVSPVWYQFLKSVADLKLGDVRDVDFSPAPTNGQQLTYDAASGTWKPGAP